jgi:protein ImuB
LRRPTALAWSVPLDEAAWRVASGGLLAFAPTVWRSPDLPCCLWVEGYGVDRAFGGLSSWCERLAEHFPKAAVVCGSGAWAVALIAAERARLGRFGELSFFTLPRPAHAPDEARTVARLPLAALALSDRDQAAIEPLDLPCVGALLDLPRAGIRQRFGDPVADQLSRLDGSGEWLLEVIDRPDPVAAELRFDHGVGDVEPLLFCIKRLLHPLLQQLAAIGRAVAAVLWSYELDPGLLPPGGAARGTYRVAPAHPSLVEETLIDLLRLRLQNNPLAAPVLWFELTLEPVVADAEQLRLFSDAGGRDIRAGEEALARLRAEFGDLAVRRATLCARHLPEARTQWSMVNELVPEPGGALAQRGVCRGLRRFFDPPRRLPSPSQGRAWSPLGGRAGAVKELIGPFPINGRWWSPAVDRVYWFAPTVSGALLWVFEDRRRHRWYLCGWLG